MLSRTSLGILLLLATAVVGISNQEARSDDESTDPLPSWNDTETKNTIVQFVESVIDPTAESFVPVEQRIATFDNDGTLWCEKPLYVHLFANFDRFAELIDSDATLANTQPYEAVTKRDLDYFVDLVEKGQIDTVVSDLFALPFNGLTVTEYAAWNWRWLADWQHPRFDVGYEQLIYQPMAELITYLQANDFCVYIFTADEGAFPQLVAEDLYGIPPERVHGSSVKLEFSLVEGAPTLTRTGETEYFNNWDGKPRLMERTLARRPIFAAGNSNGDLQMLQYVGDQDRPSLSLVVHHDDEEREYAYDSHTDKVLPAAQQDGWTVVSMKDDFRSVFPSNGP